MDGSLSIKGGNLTRLLNAVDQKPLAQHLKSVSLSADIKGNLTDIHLNPVTITAGGSGTTITGLTLTGPAEGLMIIGAQQIVLNQLQVRDASDIGLAAQGGAQVSLEQVVVAGSSTSKF